ncbi:CotD family spore coat protein [Virgibacillus chiguensis]|uniref:Spore coat protein D n=1 Tax=Virgibacillus chiguensis TaxID=411959 RepID=A0A1M5TJC0_9BACI|nr:CotD family spore coat protein [Virgibacillus chiguensis]SHH50905.1 spore coat protein D [Virgibacillus chiguensis]
MWNHHGKCCPPKQVVHPTKYDCVKQCSENVVEHIHPSHTTVQNHHTTINKHVFPHSTSVQNTNSCVDVYGGSFNVPSQVGGAMAPGMGNGQVGGAMAPGMGPGMGHGCHKPKHCQPPHKWC